LEARKIPSGDSRFSAEAVEEIELEEKVLVIRRIHVKLNLRASSSARETAERVSEIFKVIVRCIEL
jgi:hypothetical protein